MYGMYNRRRYVYKFFHFILLEHESCQKLPLNPIGDIILLVIFLELEPPFLVKAKADHAVSDIALP